MRSHTFDFSLSVFMYFMVFVCTLKLPIVLFNFVENKKTLANIADM